MSARDLQSGESVSGASARGKRGAHEDRLRYRRSATPLGDGVRTCTARSATIDEAFGAGIGRT